MIFDLPLRLFRFVFSIQSKRELRETALQLNIQITKVRRANSALIQDNEILVADRKELLQQLENVETALREAADDAQKTVATVSNVHHSMQLNLSHQQQACDLANDTRVKAVNVCHVLDNAIKCCEHFRGSEPTGE